VQKFRDWETYLDGVGEGEGDDVAGFDSGEEQPLGGGFHQLLEAGVGEVKFGGDRERSVGGKLGGDVVEDGGECGWGFHCYFA